MGNLTPSPFARSRRRAFWEYSERDVGPCPMGDWRCSRDARRGVRVGPLSGHCMDCRLDAEAAPVGYRPGCDVALMPYEACLCGCGTIGRMEVVG